MPPRFVADSMLGRLAKWLRALGFDVVYHPFADDRELVAWARERAAILLTRDTGLAKTAGVQIIFITDDHLEKQLQQVVSEAPLDLRQAAPLTRCTVCNEALVTATREEVRDQVPPYVYLTRERYARCPGCGRIYWEGTHVGRMRARLAELLAEATVGNEEGPDLV
jgi:hypothetical protein